MIISPDLNPSGTSIRTPLLTLSTLQIFGFLCKLIPPSPSLSSWVLCQALLQTPRSATLVPVVCDFGPYRSWERSFNATGFKHNVNKRGHRPSPWVRPLLKLITGEVSLPTLVLATILVFHAAHNFLTASLIQTGNLWTGMMLLSHVWSTETEGPMHIYPRYAEITLVPMRVQGYCFINQ